MSRISKFGEIKNFLSGFQVLGVGKNGNMVIDLIDKW